MTRSRRTTGFWHVDLAGERRVEESTTEHDDPLGVACRWCGRSDSIELVARAAGSQG